MTRENRYAPTGKIKYVYYCIMTEANPNARLEAFCDGVFAIALTLLIIDIKIPATEHISTTAQFWLALQHLLPGILAFLLSFITILITWVNHHGVLKLINKSTPPLNYANGLLLLTVVFVPFPTALLGDYILTDYATPSVVLYAAVFALQAFAWNLIGAVALNPANMLSKNERAAIALRRAINNSYYALFFYSACTILAFWFPLIVAIAIAASWVAWLIVGINIKEEKSIA
jgi:uncharacterized membrane protein